MSTKKSSTKKPPKTPKKKPASKAQIRQQKIAAKVLEGKSEQTIAAELGMSRIGVAKAKKHPDFPATLQALLEPHSAKYRNLFDKSLGTLEALLESGQPPSNRLAAVDRVLRIVELMQPKGPAVAVNVGVTLEQLEEMVRSAKR